MKMRRNRRPGRQSQEKAVGIDPAGLFLLVSATPSEASKKGAGQVTSFQRLQAQANGEAMAQALGDIFGSFRHCGPWGPAEGRPDDKHREAIQSHTEELGCFVLFAPRKSHQYAQSRQL